MKKFLPLLFALLFFAAPFCLAAGDDDNADTGLDTSKRVSTWVQIVMPVYVGLTAVPAVESASEWWSGCYRNFCFGMELVGLRFSSRESNLEGDLGVRFQLMNFAGPANSNSIMHTASFGIPVRGAVKFLRWGKVFAGVSGDYIVSGTSGIIGEKGRTDASDILSPFRASVEGGISWHGFGLWAGYGLTPAFRRSNARTLSFGLVIGI